MTNDLWARVTGGWRRSQPLLTCSAPRWNSDVRTPDHSRQTNGLRDSHFG